MAYQLAGASTQYLSASSPITGDTFPFTFACWFYQSTLATGVMMSTSPANGNYFGLAVLAAGNVRAIRTGVGFFDVDTSTTATANTWNHACGVFTAINDRTAYLNAGGAVNGTSAGSDTVNASDVLIGARRLNGTLGTYYTGLVAEVGIWSAALTAAEIGSLSKGVACRLIRPQSLVFYAPLIRDLIDVRGGLAITNNGTATVANHPRVYA